MAAHALTVLDATGDYVPGFLGSKAGDLDVTSAFVAYDPAANLFTFSGTMAANIGASPAGFYVFGLNRGAGTARFAVNGVPGVLFDSVVVFNQDGSGAVNLLSPTASTTSLPAGTAHLSGHTITGSVSGALLPSAGFAPTAFTWNLWPRDGTQAAGFAQISDFAPDNSNAAITPVPEPETFALMGLGLGVLAALRRRRTARAA